MGIITESSRVNIEKKQKLFSQAGMIAVRKALNAGLSITYAEGSSVVREYNDGRKEILALIAQTENVPVKRFKIK